MSERPTTLGVLEDVARERDRQDAKWGEQNHADGSDQMVRGWTWQEIGVEWVVVAHEALGRNPTWSAILVEEVGEALQTDNPAKLRAELIQVAAVAVAWVECIDQRSKGGA